MSDPYEIVGVARNANVEEIKAMFRLRSMRLHPDKGGGAGQFAELKAAYELLLDEKRRRAFDRQGVAGETPADNLESNALEWVMRSFEEAAGRGALLTGDILAEMAAFINGEIANASQTVQVINANLARMRKTAKRIRRRDKKPSKISALIEAHVAKGVLVAAEEADKLKDLHRAAKVIGAHEFEPEAFAAVPQLGAFTISMATRPGI